MKRLAMHDEGGFALIEVLVSAVLVVIVSIGVLAALDGASRASGQNKSRGVAASLAQQDVERLRAMRVQSLSNLRETRTHAACDDQGAACVTYTIASRADWVSAGTTSANCTSATDGRLDQIKVTSTVTWPNMGARKPVVSRSIVATPNGAFAADRGTLNIRVLAADGTTPQAGVTVTLAGPRSFTETTDEQGCATWGDLPAGSGYTATLSKPGLVDVQNRATPSYPVTITGQQTTVLTPRLDVVGSGTISFIAKVGTAQAAATMDRVTLEQFSYPVVLGTAGSRVASIAATGLFPGAWSIEAGDCPSELNGGSMGGLTIVPGGTGATATVELPTFAARMTNTGGTRTFWVLQTSTGCPSTTWTPTGLAPATVAGVTNRMPVLGLSPGTYTVCAQVVTGGRTYRAYRTGLTPAKGGTTVTPDITVPTSGTTADQRACTAAIP